jgi:hypothetical protein
MVSLLVALAWPNHVHHRAALAMGYSSGASLTPDLPRKLVEVDMEGVYLLTPRAMRKSVRSMPAAMAARS